MVGRRAPLRGESSDTRSHDDGPSRGEAVLGRTDSAEHLPNPPGKRPLLDVDRRSRQPSAHQHRVLLFHLRTGAVLLVGPGPPPRPKPGAKPFPGDDDLQVGPGMGRPRSRAPTVRYLPTDPRTGSEGCGAILCGAVLTLCQVDEGHESGRTTTGGPPPIVCVLPISSQPHQDPRRTRVWRCDFRDRGGHPQRAGGNRCALERYRTAFAVARSCLSHAKSHQIRGVRIRGDPMAALLLTERDVEGLLRMQDALGAVEEGLRALGRGEATNRPRQRVGTRESTVNVMLASWPTRGYSGFKYYTTSRTGIRFWVHLFDVATGELVAVIQADRLGQQRTGAASGVATKYLARPDASTVGIVGTGGQAEMQREAAAVRRGALVAPDAIERGREESGDRVEPMKRGLITWDRVHEIGEVIAGKVRGRTNADDITLFKSHGIAIEDVAVAALVYERARDAKIGKSIPL